MPDHRYLAVYIVNVTLTWSSGSLAVAHPHQHHRQGPVSTITHSLSLITLHACSDPFMPPVCCCQCHAARLPTQMLPRVPGLPTVANTILLGNCHRHHMESATSRAAGRAGTSYRQPDAPVMSSQTLILCALPPAAGLLPAAPAPLLLQGPPASCCCSPWPPPPHAYAAHTHTHTT